MLRTAVAIRHVDFEDLGTFEAVLASAGYKIHYYDVGVHDLWTLDPLQTELLIVLGGPIGVDETEIYPFLAEEVDLLRARLAENRPTFGICLGGQLIALALDAAVSPMAEKEIGFSALSLTESGRKSPLRHLTDVPVLHWHGDTFAVPEGAEALAATPHCRNQAFALGSNILAVQFHPEVNACTGLERWYIGHAVELASAGIDPRSLRDDCKRIGPALREAARRMLSEWLDGLER